MSRNKYETHNFYAKEVFSRDELVTAIKGKTKAIIFKRGMDKALELTVEKEVKRSRRKRFSTVVAGVGVIGGLLFPLALAPILISMGGVLGTLGKQELRKYNGYAVNFHEEEYILFVRAKDVNLKLDSIVFKGEVIK